jgi:nucleoside-diphosphate-sugar epimerase
LKDNHSYWNEENMQGLPEKFQSLAGKSILVTGAAGFIGGHLFRRLHEYGLDVIGTVLYPHEAEALRKQGYNAQVLDLASDEPWDDIVNGMDIVFNIAALFQEVECTEDEYEKVNNRGALKLAQTAARLGVSRFIHCSTVGVHGDVKEIPATEHTPYNPMDLYHQTKLNGELAILDFAREISPDAMALTVNRPAMVYGPGDMRMLKFFKAILSKKFRMIGSGEVLAHLGYIEDQTESFLLCAVAPRDSIHCEAFNIASGTPITLNDLASLTAECGGVKLSSFHIPLTPVYLASWACEIIYKPFGVKPPLFRRRVGFFTHNRAFDLSKSERHLGYVSKWDTRAGVMATIQWYKENGFL